MQDDTCSSISSLFSLSLTQLSSLNPGIDCSSSSNTAIQSSQVVCVERDSARVGVNPPCILSHKVEKQETCNSLRLLGARVSPTGGAQVLSSLELYRLNPGLLCDRLTPPVEGALAGSEVREKGGILPFSSPSTLSELASRCPVPLPCPALSPFADKLEYYFLLQSPVSFLSPNSIHRFFQPLSWVCLAQGVAKLYASYQAFILSISSPCLSCTPIPLTQVCLAQGVSKLFQQGGCGAQCKQLSLSPSATCANLMSSHFGNSVAKWKACNKFQCADVIGQYRKTICIPRKK